MAEIEPNILCAQSIVCSKETAVCVTRRTGGILLFLLSVTAKTIQLFVTSVCLDVAWFIYFLMKFSAHFLNECVSSLIETIFIWALFYGIQDKQMSIFDSFDCWAVTVLTVLGKFCHLFYLNLSNPSSGNLFKSPFMNVHHKSIKVVIYRQLSVQSLFQNASKFHQNNCYLHRWTVLSARFAYVYMINSTS